MLSIPVPDDPMGVTYCSKACQLESSASWHNLLFGNKPVSLQGVGGVGVIPMQSPAEEAEQQKKRRHAQEALVAHIKSIEKTTPVLTSRFLSRMISGELAKVVPSEATPPPPSNLPEPDDGTTAAFYDHIDRLRYLEVETNKLEELEVTLLKDMLNGAMAGLDEFVSGDRYLMLKGKVLFNAIGVAYSGGRLNKVHTFHLLYDSVANLPLILFSPSLASALSHGISLGRPMEPPGKLGLVSTVSHLTYVVFFAHAYRGPSDQSQRPLCLSHAYVSSV